MPDINLLDDTKDSNERKKMKPPPPPRLEYSVPTVNDGSPRPLKKPSGFGLWARSLFRRPDPKKPALQATPPQKSAAVRPAKPVSTPAGQAVDIFSDLGSEIGGPRSPAAAPTRGVIPASGRTELPPLPRPPSWQTPMNAASTSSPPPLPSTARPPIQPLGGLSPLAGGFSGASGSGIGRPVPPPPPPPKKTSDQPKPKKSFLSFFTSFGKAKQSPTADDSGESLGGVNLLPDELVTTFDPRKRLITVGLVAVATALVIGILNFGLLLWKNTQVRRTQEKQVLVREATAEIQKLEVEQRKAIALKTSNDLIRQLLNRHIYWTKFLDLFEQATLPEVRFPAGITASVNSPVSLNGVTKDLETMIRQINTFRLNRSFITEVKSDAFARDEKTGEVGFIVNLSFHPNSYFDPVDAVAESAEGAATSQ